MEMTRCGVVLTTSFGEPSGTGVAAEVGALIGEATGCGLAWVGGEIGVGGLGTK